MLSEFEHSCSRHHHRPRSISTRKSRRVSSPAMSLPQPPVPLKNHCSVIYNNTLFTYQAEAFQSLDLKDGATWSKLPMGVPTSGSRCVAGAGDSADSLFIVGGTTDPPQDDYSGLQRFSFKTKKWEACKLTVKVAKDRLNHGAAFLAQSSAILVYGGTQDGDVQRSSQTFVLSVTPPYNVQAFNSDAPPVIDPLMLPWNSSHALMLGGDAQNTKLFTFGPLDGWRKLDATLKQGLANANQVQTAIMDGSDGSKLLEIFDLSTSPNNISTLLLRAPTTTTASSQPSATEFSSFSPSPTQRSSRKRKRETLAERPAYNSTLAPQDTRNGFSLAQDPRNGLIVASGGNSQDVLCIFNQTGNQWVNAQQFFGTSRTTTSPTIVQTPTSSLASTSAPPTNTPPSGNTNSTHHSLTILGATLGAIFGVAALLLLLLLLLRCVRRRREDEHRRRSSDYPLGDKHGMDFADQGDENMREAGGSFGHHNNNSGRSAGSGAAAASARAGSAQSKRGFLHKPSGSGESAKSFFSRSKSPLTSSPPMISEPIMQPPPGERNFSSKPMASPEPRTEPRTDTGWSKYWQNSNNNLESTGGGVNRHSSAASRPTTYTSASQSEYAASTSTHPHESAEVQPLNIRSSQIPPNSRIVSPTSGLPLPGLALTHSNHGVIGPEPQSPSTPVSDIDEEDEYRLHQPSSHEGQDSWTPVQTSDRNSTWTDPRVSSVYDTIYPHPGERVRIPNFPGVPPSRRPSDNNTATAPNDSGRGMRSTAARDFGRGQPHPTAEERELPEVGIRREREWMERERMERLEPQRLEADRITRGQQQQQEPEIRTFPRRLEELGPRGRGGLETEDMSWLNLGR